MCGSLLSLGFKMGWVFGSLVFKAGVKFVWRTTFLEARPEAESGRGRVCGMRTHTTFSVPQFFQRWSGCEGFLFGFCLVNGKIKALPYLFQIPPESRAHRKPALPCAPAFQRRETGVRGTVNAVHCQGICMDDSRLSL